ncbi:uracil-DNA glycosylase [Candidatus Vondammii sp. HM_W22]|uniref:uracil-DNA glycosylase n=1 Tax=Candidatus Vondammii sp. HM_W22 TaxID=2687299 RepID=UPI001F134CE2|nr:uracil-DNA glycosylase [Candidatus Vondammii sp. HM_W22]
MDDLLRRQYLEAMGIGNWLPRQMEAGQNVAVEQASLAQPEISDPPLEARLSEAAPVAETNDSIPSLLNEAPPLAEEFAPSMAPEEMAHEVPERGIAGLDWKDLNQRVTECQACGLDKTRTKTVFGVGEQTADLMVIGEAPGADEDRKGEPFVGRAGQLLTRMLRAIGLNREQVFIANILKCRPPGNRDPRSDEVQKCEPFLQRQVTLVKPKVILAVGRVAAHNLLKSDETLGRMRGKTFNYNGIPVVVSYHPAYLLRSPEQKAKSWQDLQRTLRLLNHERHS